MAESAAGTGLPSLRRSGRVTELLFLYECTTQQPTQLRPIADSLGLTVQAASHSFRRLAARGLAEFKGGHYRPTVRGVAWLHDAFGKLTTDLTARSSRLHVVQTTRAVAAVQIPAGAPVVLELREGTLIARPGAKGASTGEALASASAGGLVPIGRLEGIVPVELGRVQLWIVPAGRLEEPSIVRELATRIRLQSGMIAAPGLEAFHLLGRATHRPVVRYGVGPACWEATRVGVDAAVVLMESELPRFLEQFTAPDPPRLTISRLGEGRTSRVPRRARRR